MGKLMFQGTTVAFAFLWTAWESLRDTDDEAPPAAWASPIRRWRTASCSGARWRLQQHGTITNCVGVAMHIDVMNDRASRSPRASRHSAGGAAAVALMPPHLVPRVRALALGGSSCAAGVVTMACLTGLHLRERRGRQGDHAERARGTRHGAPRAQGSRIEASDVFLDSNQMRVVLEQLLPKLLESRGISDAGAICSALLPRLPRDAVRRARARPGCSSASPSVS